MKKDPLRTAMNRHLICLERDIVEARHNVKVLTGKVSAAGHAMYDCMERGHPENVDTTMITKFLTDLTDARAHLGRLRDQERQMKSMLGLKTEFSLAPET